MLTSTKQHTQKIETLLFDLDGTLVDTAADFIAVLNDQLLNHGYSMLDEALIRNTVSNGSKALIQIAFGGNEGEQEFEQYRTELLENYYQIVGDHAVLFPGMAEVLADCQIKNIPWGIITNKPRRFTEKLLEQLGLDNNCALVLCADDVSKPKPDPESMFLAAKTLNVNLNTSVYIGDHERDIVAGKAAGMVTVAAAYGYITQPLEFKNWDADYIIQHPFELKTLFLA